MLAASVLPPGEFLRVYANGTDRETGGIHGQTPDRCFTISTALYDCHSVGCVCTNKNIVMCLLWRYIV